MLYKVWAQEIGWAAMAYTKWSGGNCYRLEMVVCNGGWGHLYHGGGTTFGTTYVAGNDRYGNANDGSDVIAHEMVHMGQWQTIGPAFAVDYFRAGLNPCKNKYEIQAGLKKEGYLQC